MYHHFSSKQALFEAVFVALETMAVQRSAAASRQGEDAWQSALLPLGTMTSLTFAMLNAAGQALSTTPEQEKPRGKAEYGEVIGRLMAGLAT